MHSVMLITKWVFFSRSHVGGAVSLFVVRDANGQALSYAYFEDESGRPGSAPLPAALVCRGIGQALGKQLPRPYVSVHGRGPIEQKNGMNERCGPHANAV
jgi:hypothetical protein